MLNKLKPWTWIGIKVVERAGDKIQDLLHKSDPWEDEDCNRKSCPTCQTSTESDENPFKSCTKRSIVYQTWCKTCEKKENREKDVFEESELGIENLFDEKKEEKVSMKRKVMDRNKTGKEKFIYIGETSRSSYERGNEHMKDLEFKRHRSHMLKHVVNHHPTSNPDHIKFGMKILSSHKTAFERQIREAVLIEKFAGPKLMNSKLEYDRCSIPRISMKMGNEE